MKKIYYEVRFIFSVIDWTFLGDNHESLTILVKQIERMQYFFFFT